MAQTFDVHGALEGGKFGKEGLRHSEGVLWGAC